MSSTDKRGIPIVQSSDKLGSKRKVSEGEDEIKLYRPQNKQRNIEYFRTSSTTSHGPSSPRLDSSQHATTEPLYSTHSFSPLRSPSFTSDIYLKPRNSSLARKPKRKPDELELVSPKKKIHRSSQINDTPQSSTSALTPKQRQMMRTPSPTRFNTPVFGQHNNQIATPPPTEKRHPHIVRQKYAPAPINQRKELLTSILATPPTTAQRKERSSSIIASSPGSQQNQYMSTPPRTQPKVESVIPATPPRTQQKEENITPATPPRIQQKEESITSATPPRIQQKEESITSATLPTITIQQKQHTAIHPTTTTTQQNQYISTPPITQQKEESIISATPPTITTQQKQHKATPLTTPLKEIAATPTTPIPTKQKDNLPIYIQEKENISPFMQEKKNLPTYTSQNNNEIKKYKVNRSGINAQELERRLLGKEDDSFLEEERAALEAIKAAEAEEIAELMKTVKCLPNYYKLLSKIGEGTFSTVYKALDIRREHYDNQDWEAPLIKVESEEQSPKPLNEFVALKRIYDTSSPRRIANEVYILRKLRGSPCISPIITAFRQLDQVFIVMPYIQSDDFKSLLPDMSMAEMKCYLRSLFTALYELHQHEIIHRDVKPNNFLYNRKKKIGYLIDFGLAEHISEGQKLEEYDIKIESRAQNNMFIQSSRNAAIRRIPLKQPTGNSSVLASLSNKENRATAAQTPTATNTTTNTSSIPSTPSNNDAEEQRAGYVQNDARHHVRANRAGTRGFRAPEILLKVTKQTCAIDIWAAGVILSCFMTGRYPFFLANEEADAIVELGQVYGFRELKKCAHYYERTFSSNINIPLSKVPWQKLVEHLNKEAVEEWDPEDYKNALDLLERALDLNHNTRITAEEALEHPFLR